MFLPLPPLLQAAQHQGGHRSSQRHVRQHADGSVRHMQTGTGLPCESEVSVGPYEPSPFETLWFVVFGIPRATGNSVNLLNPPTHTTTVRRSAGPSPSPPSVCRPWIRGFSYHTTAAGRLPPQGSCADYIGAMSSMCTDMPYMDGCDVYAQWCQAAALWEADGGSSLRHFCAGADAYGGSSSSSIPPMLMFFHQRTQEILLFRSWLPKTTGRWQRRQRRSSAWLRRLAPLALAQRLRRQGPGPAPTASSHGESGRADAP